MTAVLRRARLDHPHFIFLLVVIVSFGQRIAEMAYTHQWGQELSGLSIAEEGLFTFTRENSSHTIDLGTTIAPISRKSPTAGRVDAGYRQ